MTEKIRQSETLQWLWKERKLIVSIFLAGWGIMFWVMTFLFNPVNDLRADLRVFQTSVNQTNTAQDVAIEKVEKKQEADDKEDSEVANRVTRIEAVVKP